MSCVIAAILLSSTLVPTASADTSPPAQTTVDRIPLASTPTDREQVRSVRPAAPFRMVALTWRGPAPDRAEIRHRDSEGWSSWTPLTAADRGPDRASPVDGTEPLWTDHATAAQVRASRNGRDVTRELQFVAIDPGTATAPPATAKGARPPVVTRAEWGADESHMTWPPDYTATTKAVTVHHTAGTNDYSCADSAALVRGIYEYHAVELGWGDIGYQALVDQCGTTFEGRTGGLDGNVVGGHSGGFNQETFGVSMMGNLDLVEPTPQELEAVSAISAWKLGESGVDPLGTTTLVSTGEGTSKYPPGAEVSLPTIFAHRDVGDTLCPGQYGYARMQQIRDWAAEIEQPQP